MTTTAASTSTAPYVARDYSLTGPAAHEAIERGLASGDWYRPAIDPARLQALMVRTNGRAARDIALWLGLLALAAVLAFRSLGHWWAVPAFLAYGTLYGSSADPRWHECGHGTAFRNRRANDAVYLVASFMLLREATLWRWSHVRHHSDTIVVGRDPEIIVPRPFRLRALLPNVLNLRGGPAMLKRTVRHAVGSIDGEARDLVPEHELRRVVWEARLYVAVLLGTVVWSVAVRSIVPLLFVGLPSFYGTWLMLFFGLTQHIGLREDVLDHRLNTRTVHMNPGFRFLYLNMNYHLEHHLFPSVPYHALPELHAEVGGQLPPPKTSCLAAYREVVHALREQARDPRWELPVPAVVAAHPWTGTVGPTGAAGTPTITISRAGADAAGPVDLGGVDAVDPGAVVRVDCGERSFALCRSADGAYALVDGVCTHGRAHLADGAVVDGTIECPKHNGRFDLRTGAPVRRPAMVAIRRYDVTVVDGRLRADLGPQMQHPTGSSTGG